MSSASKMILLIAEKETFLVRVLLKKLEEAAVDVTFVTSKINKIDAEIDKAATLVYYLDASEHLQPELLQYFKDKLTQTDKQMAIIGEKNDIDNILQSIVPSLIWHTFVRPLDTDLFLSKLKTQLSVIDSDSAKKTVLIVDDDPTYIGVIRDWLKGKYKVGMANSGIQALQWLGLNTPDLILLDFEMPVTSGPQVLEMLKSDPSTSNIPVFFLTSRNDKESVMKVMALGPENYLLKTIERKELLQKLDEFFMRKKYEER